MDWGSGLSGAAAGASGGPWGAIAGGILGLFGGHKKYHNPMEQAWNQYAPGYLMGQQRSYNYLTSDPALHAREAALMEGTDTAARNAAYAAQQNNSMGGGIGSDALAGFLNYGRNRDVAQYRTQARDQQMRDAYNMAGGALGTLGGAAQTGAQLTQQQMGYDQQNNGLLSALPYLLQAMQKPDNGQSWGQNGYAWNGSTWVPVHGKPHMGPSAPNVNWWEGTPGANSAWSY